MGVIWKGGCDAHEFNYFELNIKGERMVCSELLALEIKKSRKLLLDVLEATVGNTPPWPAMRSVVLRVFGNDGLGALVNASEQEELTAASSDENSIY